MDALLNQMIAVDDQAARLVKAAEDKAADILLTARREADALEKALDAECQAEVDALIRSRTGAAEQLGAQERELDERRLEDEKKRLLEQVPALSRTIAAVLAFPRSAAP